jgi:hypothetical protein
VGHSETSVGRTIGISTIGGCDLDSGVFIVKLNPLDDGLRCAVVVLGL